MSEKLLQSKAITGIKEYVKGTIDYAKYKIGNTYYEVPIHRKEYLEDGRLAAYFAITPQSQTDVTIKEVQIYDVDKGLWLKKNEDIKIRSVQEGVLYRFTFDVREV